MDAAPEALIRASYLGGRGASHGETLSTLAKEMLRGLHAEPGRYALGDDELARIDKPVLMIWGQAEDGVILSIAEARMKAALMPNARFEVLAGGHEPWLDDPNGRADLVSAFLRTGSAARTSRQFGT